MDPINKKKIELFELIRMQSGLQEESRRVQEAIALATGDLNKLEQKKAQEQKIKRLAAPPTPAT